MWMEAIQTAARRARNQIQAGFSLTAVLSGAQFRELVVELQAEGQKTPYRFVDGPTQLRWDGIDIHDVVYAEVAYLEARFGNLPVMTLRLVPDRSHLRY